MVLERLLTMYYRSAIMEYNILCQGLKHDDSFSFGSGSVNKKTKN